MLRRTDLHTYQYKSVDKVRENPKYYLALGTGLGKTAISLTAIVDIKPNKTLIVAPKRVAMDVWERESAKWSHTKHLTFNNLVGLPPKKRMELLNDDADVYIINTELISWLLDCYPKKKLPFDFIIFDESHVFKDYSSKRFKKIKTYVPHFNRVLMLSATPASNSLIDLWSQIYMLDNGERLGKFIGKFKNQYFDSDYMGYTWTPKPNTEYYIYEKLSDIMMSLQSEDYLELPSLIVEDNIITLDPKARELYTELKREQVLSVMHDKEDKVITADTAAVLSSRLLQLASGTAYAYDESTNERSTVLVHNAKIEVLKELVSGLQGEPVLLLYKYRADIERIKQAISSVHTLDEDNIVSRWNNKEIPVLLVNPQSASCGLNLQKGGHYIIEFTPSFSFQDTYQVYRRLYRQGQQHPVIVTRLLCENTMDTRVVSAVNDKQSSHTALVNAVKYEIDHL